MRRGTLDVGGVGIAYEEHGRGGRPFVLVHGFTGSRDDWKEHLPEFGRRSRTLAIDQRGHGESHNSGDEASYTLDRLVDDLAGALDALEVERCDLLGHSMGGMVALRFALAHPDRLASLILMDTAAESIQMTPAGMLEAFAKGLRELGGVAMAENMRKAAESGTRPQADSQRATVERMGPEVFWGRIATKLSQMDPAAASALGAELADQLSVRERLGEITCPTLVIAGEQDLPFIEPSRHMADAIPDARLVIVPDAAHSPQHENASAWFRAISEHLEHAAD